MSLKAFSLLLLITIICIAAINLFNVDNLNEKERASRVLMLNFQSCGEIAQLSKDFGEGTSTVRCTNGKTYLLSALEHCHDFFSVYCWKVRELHSDTILKQYHKSIIPIN
uniref:Uncharacterized protein n=1 Tax=Cyanothece sp. (strain PCC 7425 / ATCC 29141) TaxID=395961 RepID=B8HSN6_CYAP4